MGVEPGIPAMARAMPAGPAPAASLLVPDRLDAQLIREWRLLGQRAAEPNCFLQPWFLLPSLKRLTGGADIRIVAVHAGTRMIGLMPVHIEPDYGRAPIAHVENWMHGQSFLGTPLLAAGHEQEAAAAIIGLLDRSDWAKGFLHLTGIVENGAVHRGFAGATEARHRPCAIVHRHARALIESDLDGEAYLENAIRGKKRKEFRRQANRLAEQGEMRVRSFGTGDDAVHWCADFLALERAGWKGRDGAAFANESETRRFFEDVVLGAADANMLDMLRIDLDGRAVAMLVNFTSGDGAFSYKIAYDEDYARFSPGVLVELENILRLQANPGIAWMDSCAAEGHPMIDRLWTERRSIVRLTIPLAGPRRRAAHFIARTAERSLDAVRRLISTGDTT